MEPDSKKSVASRIKNKRAEQRKKGYGFRTNNNRNMERKQAKQRAADYRAARAEPGADKSKLKREYTADKRARRADARAEHNLRLNAWRRRHGEKKYNRDKGTDNYNPSDHKDFLGGTGPFQQKNIDAYNDYRDNYRKYKQNPGSLSAKYERKTPGLKEYQSIF